MARDGGGIGGLVTLGLVGLAGYLFWPQISSLLGIGAAAAVPAGGTAPPATPSGGATPAVPAAPAPPPKPAFSQLDAVYGQMLAAAVADYQAGDRSNQLALINGVPQTTWSAWNYFLNKVAPAVGALPGYQDVTGQTDLNVPMTGPQYWAVMAPWLTTNRGFSGLGVFAGLAGLAFRGRAGR